MALGGLVSGITYGLITSDVAGWVADLVELALLQVPAIWVIAGVTILLYGVAPGMATWSWGVLVASLLLGQLGPILQLPQWAMNLSPFTHVPIPPEPVSATPLLLLVALAVTLLIAGLGGLARRDLR
jgi:ABC-2 type transport system permease protein